MDVRSLYVALSADLTRFSGNIATASGQVRALGTDVMGMSDRSARSLDQLGRTSGRAAAGAAIGLGLMAKAAVDWESQFAGVAKTVDASTAGLNALEDDLRSMAREMPATHEEIAATAAAAGQLGIAAEDIEDFTRVMVMMGETTNLTSEDAATAIAQFMNVLQSAPESVENIANTIVDLGNKGASTEQQITDMAQRLAGAGALVGASEADILGLSAAMANLGIQAQLGGGAVQRVFVGIESAVASGSDKVDQFARVAGMSADDFAATWQASPMDAFNAIITGLSDIQAGGGNVVQALSDMGIKGTENLQVMLRLAGSGDQLSKSLEQSANAWEENTALTTEYGKRAETDAAKIAVAWNRIRDAAIDVGAATLPVIAEIADVIGGMADAFGELPDPVQEALVGLLAISAVLGGAFWFGTKVVGGIRNTRLQLAQMRGENTVLTASMTRSRASVQGFTSDLRLMASTAMTAGARTQREIARVEAASTRMRRRAVTAAKGGAAVAGGALLISGVADDANLTNAALGAMMGTIAGPWGAAVGGAIGLVQDFRGANDDLEQSFRDVDAALSQGVAGLEQARALIAANREEVQGLAESWRFTGDVSTDSANVMKAAFNPQFWSEVFGDQLSGEIDRINEDIASVTDQEDALYAVGLALGQVFETNPDGSVAFALEDLTQVAERAQPALDALGYTWEELTAMDRGELDVASRAIRDWLVNADTAAGNTDELAAALLGLEDEMSTVEDRAGNLKDAMDQLFGANLNLSAATDAWQQGLRSLNDDLSENSRRLLGNTEGAAQNREVLRGRIEDLQDMLQAEADAGAGPMKLARMLESSRDDLVKWGVQAGLDEDALRGFIKQMGLTPKSISTIFETLGIDEAEVKARDLVDAYNELPRNVRTFVSQNGGMEAGRMTDILIEKYGLTPKQVLTVLEARDDASVKIDGVKAKLRETDQAPPAQVEVDADTAAAMSALNAVMSRLFGIDGFVARTSIVTTHSDVQGGPGRDDPDYSGHGTERRGGRRGNTREQMLPGRGRAGSERFDGGRGGSTTVVQQRMPDRLTLEVEGQKFTAFVRGHAARAATDVVDAHASSGEASNRMGWA